MSPKKQQLKPLLAQTTLAHGYERLEKVLAHTGLASRREAKQLIADGVVAVNGTIVTEPGFGVRPGTDTVEMRVQSEKKESVLVYKPKGIETTKTSPLSRDIHDQFPQLRHLSPVGRLDKESAGIIILSNDGTVTKALTKADSTVGKRYLVTVRENVSDKSLAQMRRGIMLDKVLTRPAVVRRLSRTSFSLTIYEGRKHQIRRMADACHLTIASLERVGIGHLEKGSVKTIRKLGAQDIELLKR